MKPRRGQGSRLLFGLLCGPHGKARRGCHRHFVQDRFGCSSLRWVNSQKYFNLLNATLWAKVAFLAFQVHRGGGGGPLWLGGSVKLDCSVSFSGH